jgi:hypothetical protein
MSNPTDARTVATFARAFKPKRWQFTTASRFRKDKNPLPSPHKRCAEDAAIFFVLYRSSDKKDSLQNDKSAYTKMINLFGLFLFPFSLPEGNIT